MQELFIIIENDSRKLTRKSGENQELHWTGSSEYFNN